MLSIVQHPADFSNWGACGEPVLQGAQQTAALRKPSATRPGSMLYKSYGEPQFPVIWARDALSADIRGYAPDTPQPKSPRHKLALSRSIQQINNLGHSTLHYSGFSQL